MDVADPRRRPQLELAREWVAVPVLADGIAEEVAYLAPSVSERASGERQPCADVELPGRPSDPTWHAELERRDDATRANDADELRERRTGVLDVAEEVGERQVVEARSIERQAVGGGLHELDLTSESPPRAREHLRALVDPGDAMPSATELGGDEPCSGRDVEHMSAAGREAGDEEPSPARVLAERERGPDAVVRGPEWREELRGVDRRHAAYCGDVGLADEIESVAAAAAEHVDEGGSISGALATEPQPGNRVYLCSVDGADGTRGWLGVREDGSPVTSRVELRAAVSIAALCEVAVDAAGGGDLDGLLASLADLRTREAPEGIEDAEAAARALREVVGDPPQLASPERLEAIGSATRRLEAELDPGGVSPFAAALKSAQGAVSELQREVEAGYLVPLT